ncbi:hypothetical protein MLD38_000358 [Melastoma candidum]|uniref:Uncharacterized protein n=1 Tax=Melastoma candidum TaxID=119954 RepID=A0ACB9SER0_9MYRT|nr:hypothetical protein MLD38_000358 [Melastoma candidum]
MEMACILGVLRSNTVPLHHNYPFHSLFAPFPPDLARARKNPFRPLPLCLPLHAKPKKDSRRDHQPPALISPAIVEEVSLDYDDDFLDNDEVADVIEDDYEDEDYPDGDDDDFLEEGASEVYVGDGGEGGGISLAGTWWDKEALAIAEGVTASFDNDLKIYSFRTMSNCSVQVRIEKQSNRSGSPSMDDIEAFSTVYRSRLDEAEVAKLVPNNLSLEVSSPGVERVVRIPQDLDRFKDRPMYVKYVREQEANGSSPPSETDGIFRLISFDMETSMCTWGLADVRKNREKAGKGRPLSKKQREWRLDTPFDSLRLVRLYSEM